MSNATGTLLREWRTRRRFSQLELANLAEVSMKHLSYVETGRAKPSPEMILHLSRHLDIPLRQRNDILLAAGYAPRYRETPYDPANPDELNASVERVVNAYTHPAVAVDADWNLLTANAAASIFLVDVAHHLLTPPINVVRLSLHPEGLAPRVANYAEYAAHVISRVERIHANAPTPTLTRLLDDYGHLAGRGVDPGRGILLPLELETAVGCIRLFSTITTFGSPHDLTLAELAIETFFPTDPDSARRLTTLTGR